ncbi:GntR family transcriptional regulator [Pseudoduganella flava]|uniref:GntR family transcriptional regulator n=1 Tax=Pseudoduganella flava TaxID=871742 RepID=A0A562Q088_9BURK|nr:GntR family transcriptional regulator [Pseudoduganella flava]QGZ38381.1 GntR family transcriptional regulator [Pseudoduganella flava]TWI50077.1 GntR family transcriptional regulator [Pseudoduganella flava]
MAEHTALLFSIATGSPDPIYRQLIEQVKRLCAAGVLKPGDTLPSVREVAQALAVNPMTVSKAYNLLEMEGVLERLRGQGMQVAQRRRQGKGEREALLRPALERAAREARQLELDDATILELFKQVLKEAT